MRSLAVLWLYGLGVANGLAGDVITSVLNEGFWSALSNTFNISIVIVSAAIVGMNLAARAPGRPSDIYDVLVCAIYLFCVAVPASKVSWVALTFLAVYESVRAGSTQESAAACLFVCIAISKLWGNLAVDFFSPLLLDADAAMVAAFLSFSNIENAERLGNLVESINGQPIAIMIGCSSFSNVPYALLCWMTVVRGRRPTWRWHDLPVALAVIGIAVILNVIRMALMVISRESYFVFHGPVGAHVYTVVVLVAAMAAGWLSGAPSMAPRLVTR
jgi:hypothetical protein